MNPMTDEHMPVTVIQRCFAKEGRMSPRLPMTAPEVQTNLEMALRGKTFPQPEPQVAVLTLEDAWVAWCRTSAPHEIKALVAEGWREVKNTEVVLPGFYYAVERLMPEVDPRFHDMANLLLKAAGVIRVGSARGGWPNDAPNLVNDLENLVKALADYQARL